MNRTFVANRTPRLRLRFAKQALAKVDSLILARIVFQFAERLVAKPFVELRCLEAMGIESVNGLESPFILAHVGLALVNPQGEENRFGPTESVANAGSQFGRYCWVCVSGYGNPATTPRLAISVSH